MQFEFEGKQYKFSHYGAVKFNEIFIDNTGMVIRWDQPLLPSSDSRLILKPVEIYHTFGGVVWKEEEFRSLVEGEVGLTPTGNLVGFLFNSSHKYIHLIPIALAI